MQSEIKRIMNKLEKINDELGKVECGGDIKLVLYEAQGGVLTALNRLSRVERQLSKRKG